MDFNDDAFLDWVLQQTQIGPQQQQQQQQQQQPLNAPQQQKPPVGTDQAMAAEAAPFALTFGDPAHDPDLDMLFLPQQWDQETPMLSNNSPQFNSGSSTSGSSSSDGSEKEASPQFARSPSSPSDSYKERSTTTTLKPFIPGDGDASRNNTIRTMPTTGRLDFRVAATPDYNVSAADLKNMSSKERRQLRNKISARNFRQRRKDYITSLEDEIDQLKSEKAQLKLEVSKVYEIVGSLRKENDQLRADLTVARQQPQQTTPPPPPPQTSMSAITVPNNTDENALTTWDALLRDSTWLSHAAMPEWDFSHVLSKNQEKNSLMLRLSTREMFQRYPLLAPALMSIVLDHTMGMSSDQLLAASTHQTAGSSLHAASESKAFLPLIYDNLHRERRASIREVKDDDDDDDDSDENMTADDQHEDQEQTELVRSEGDHKRYCEWIKSKLCCLNGQCGQRCCMRNLACYVITTAYEACVQHVQQLTELKARSIEAYARTTEPQTPPPTNCPVQCGC